MNVLSLRSVVVASAIFLSVSAFAPAPAFTQQAQLGRSLAAASPECDAWTQCVAQCPTEFIQEWEPCVQTCGELYICVLG